MGCGNMGEVFKFFFSSWQSFKVCTCWCVYALQFNVVQLMRLCNIGFIAVTIAPPSEWTKAKVICLHAVATAVATAIVLAANHK